MTEVPLAVITHGWECRPTFIWIPDTKRKLEAVGYETLAPHMYRSRQPNRQEWINSLSDAIGERKDVTVVAHSCSGRSALHYVQERNTVRNLIVVSAFVDCIGEDMEEEWREFYGKPLDAEAIKANCPNIVGLYSEDDPVISYDQADLFEARLGRVERFKGQGHFLGRTLPVDLAQLLT